MRCDFCDGGGNLTQLQKNEDAKKLALLESESQKRKCESGNKNYCSTAEEHPLELAAFVATGLVGGPVVENFILGGGLANSITATYTTLYTAGVNLLTRWATQNPDGIRVSLGSNGAYQRVGRALNYTYFELPNKVYNMLNRIGVAKDVNKQFINNQIQQAKSFVVTVTTENPGKGTIMEMIQIRASGLYNQISSLWPGVTEIFTPK